VTQAPARNLLPRALPLAKMLAVVAGAVVLAVGVETFREVQTPSLALRGLPADERYTVLDRLGQPLGISYQTQFNLSDRRSLQDVPEILRLAVVTAEDRRFYDHAGVDWRARFSALWQNFRARHAVRGASTITEQVVRIIHPRTRTLWSRWVEGFEAMALERHASKQEILEFYLNQVPFAANRRGFAQAARYYFNRDLTTLTQKEMLALAVLPRAPSALDPYRKRAAVEPVVQRLARAMEARGALPTGESLALRDQPLTLERASPLPNASHFVTHIRESAPFRLSKNGALQTSLDSSLQVQVQSLLDDRLKALARKQVHNGAALVVDHTTGEILAWVVGGADANPPLPGAAIDAVRTPRQPGSSMKPFLYALALDSGWSPATALDDAPLAEAIGTGLHDFHNYSHTFYGKISLREALGNSLNIPALETIGFVTPARYLDTLHNLGFNSLTQPSGFYKDGLALGNGEVTLLEMVQGFSTLANHGVLRPLTPLLGVNQAYESQRVYSPEAASLIGNILSDPYARRREFGISSVLNMPGQTAVKTGTSNDYRDAWVMGYNSRYAVGVWLGNLDQQPMDGVTGSTGPALVLRSIFAVLEQRQPSEALYLSPRLVQREVCADAAITRSDCYLRSEYFLPDTVPPGAPAAAVGVLKLVRPTEGLQLAYDPRVPQDRQAFEFVADGIPAGHDVQWLLNGEAIAQTSDGHFLWPLARGTYRLEAKLVSPTGATQSTQTAHFSVK
jgi:penicillin-binding protein 1C